MNITDLSFVFAFVFILFLVFTLTKLARIPLFSFSLPLVFIIYFVIVAYLGVFPLYFHWDDYTIALGVSDKKIILRIFFYSSISIILILTTFLLCSKFSEFRIFHLEKQPPNSFGSLSLLISLLMFAVCVAVMLLFLTKIPGIPLFAAVSGDFNLAARLRSSSTNDFTGHAWRYRLFYSDILSYLSYLFFGHALSAKKMSIWFLFILIFSFAFFASIFTIQKAPAAWLLAGLGVAFIVMNGGKIRVKKIFMIGSLLMLTIIFLYIVLFNRDLGIIGTAYKVITRITLGNMIPSYFYLEMFPKYHNFLFGQSFPNPGGIFPFEPYRLTVEISKFMFGDSLPAGLVGSAPTAFWGEQYANFGMVGPILGSIVVGLYLAGLSSLVSRLPPHPATTALVVWVTLDTMNLALGGLFDYFFNVPLWVMIFLTFVFLFLDGGGRIPFKVHQRTALGGKRG